MRSAQVSCRASLAPWMIARRFACSSSRRSSHCSWPLLSKPACAFSANVARCSPKRRTASSYTVGSARRSPSAWVRIGSSIARRAPWRAGATCTSPWSSSAASPSTAEKLAVGADALSRLDGEAGGEQGQSREQRLLGRRYQPNAPLDRRLQRAVTDGRVTPRRTELLARAAQAFEDRPERAGSRRARRPARGPAATRRDIGRARPPRRHRIRWSRTSGPRL